MKDAPYLINWSTPDDAKELIPKRRGAVVPLPLISASQARKIQKVLFAEYGLEDFVDCITAEMKSRPVPHAFKVERTQKLTALYEHWAPAILARLITEIEPPVQAYNKISRLGWPELDVPDDKQPVLEFHFNQIQKDGMSAYADSFIVPGVRLQTEPASKVRQFLFLSKEKGVYEREITVADRSISAGELGDGIASRTRLIFNMPMPNLYKQVLDTALHNAMLKYPAFHHNMYGNPHATDNRKHRALDVKHFERFTAAVVRARARIIGGMYAEISTLFTKIPFLVPTDDWKSNAFITPNREAGWSEQFASGDSAVAPAQKEVFIALYAEYFKRSRKLQASEAIALVLNGGDASLTILNYGDDNFFFGTEYELEAVFEFLKEYLDVEIEDPPKFLGFLFTDKGFKLGVNSYLTKTYTPERSIDTIFRKYPALGWMLKRETYSQFGLPVFANSLFSRENELLRKEANTDWAEIIALAIREKREQMINSAMTNNDVLLDKAYLLPESEKIRLGLFFGFHQDKTAPIVKHLLGAEWHSKLKF